MTDLMTYLLIYIAIHSTVSAFINVKNQHKIIELLKKKPQ